VEQPGWEALLPTLCVVAAASFAPFISAICASRSSMRPCNWFSRLLTRPTLKYETLSAGASSWLP
jgi:hypothetical protein